MTRTGYAGPAKKDHETFSDRRTGINSLPFLRKSTNRANGNDTERITCRLQGQKDIPGSYLKNAKCIQKSDYSTEKKIPDGVKYRRIPEKNELGQRRGEAGED